MNLNSDYLELNLYLQNLDDDESVDLYVHCRDRSMLKFEKVRHNPLRHEGSWSISHEYFGKQATSYIPADDVWYFTVIHQPDTATEPDI